MRKFLTIVIIAFVELVGIFIYCWFYYAFAEGNRSGQLIRFMNEGYVFKTYEG